MLNRAFLATVLTAMLSWSQARAADAPLQFSGIYPHLAYFNNEGECGTGAVVPWADRLWVITYGPHLPKGSSDKLYEIDPALTLTVRPESIGGTPANRMIHDESGQLFIGPYAIDKERNVRVIPYSAMPGRHTANMRHLSEPANKIYYATMEEGIYEVDVKTLAVKQLYVDGNSTRNLAGDLLPGYHGKGGYSGQGLVVYANNGDRAPEALKRPDVPSGCLAQWDGKDWKVVLRNQFCDVTGPGGIHGNPNPASDPIWSIGWDHRSLLLMCLDGGSWRRYRLPKATHSYDGAHGWNTEWPRIREIGEGDNLLMTMHGTFWKFPKTFSAKTTAGIRPRSTYLKVIGDFTRWNDRLVFGCDDTAKSEFLNKRKAKGDLAGPGQSQSNLWFTDPSTPDKLGPVLGRGAVWVNEEVNSGKPSDPFLFAGYDRRAVHLSHTTATPVKFDFEVDAEGREEWKPLKSVTVPAKAYAWVEFPAAEKGEWVRVTLNSECDKVTAMFTYANADPRGREADGMFDGLAKPGEAEAIGGLVRARGDNKRTLQVGATKLKGKASEFVGSYELGADMKLHELDDTKADEYINKHAAIPEGVLSVDAASVLFVDDAGKRWRLPRGGDASFDALTGAGVTRMDREVCTERDLFNAHGTFYELPAENAGGFAKVRPVTTHNRRIHDYCSYRGLLILTGIAGGEKNPHIIRSENGKASVWAGAVDDLWKIGKPVGQGGPWKDSAVKANVPSDPYLITGYDRKTLTLKQTGADSVHMRVEIDLTGDGHWVSYRAFDLAPGVALEHKFPEAFQAYWVRIAADKDCTATAWLDYE